MKKVTADTVQHGIRVKWAGSLTAAEWSHICAMQFPRYPNLSRLQEDAEKCKECAGILAKIQADKPQKVVEPKQPKQPKQPKAKKVEKEPEAAPAPAKKPRKAKQATDSAAPKAPKAPKEPKLNCRPPAKHESKVGRNVPAWALKVVHDETKRCQEGKEVLLLWTVYNTFGRRSYVSATAWTNGRRATVYGHRVFLPPCIKMNVGSQTAHEQQLAVLLHEIAHHNVGHAAAHGPKFCAEAVRLYRKYGLLQYLAEKIEVRVHYTGERKAVLRAWAKSQAAELAYFTR